MNQTEDAQVVGDFLDVIRIADREACLEVKKIDQRGICPLNLRGEQSLLSDSLYSSQSTDCTTPEIPERRASASSASRFKSCYDVGDSAGSVGGKRKASRAEEVIAAGGVISVQVLNEFVAVTTRKLAMSWPEIEEVLTELRAVLRVEALTIEAHERSLTIAKRYNDSIYDSLIVASALNAGCTLLYSENFQHGQRMGDILSVCNPFIG